MESMRREINGLKDSVSELKATTAELKTTTARLDATLNRVMITVAKIDGNMTEMRRDMATKQDISLLNERMDGFSGLLLDSRHRWAVHANTLVEHDERLKALEKKAS